MPGAVSEIATLVEQAGHDFYTWADWYPGGHPDTRWTKKVLQAFPSTRHWVHHSVTSAFQDPAHAARTINDIGIARFGKMSYPFLIHATGAVLQGCYPYIGAHSKNYNSTSLAGCNIGNYEELVPSQAMVEGNIVLIRALIETGHYPHPIEILGHRQSPFARTACPGKYIMARLNDIRIGGNTSPIPPEVPVAEAIFYDDPDPTHRGTYMLAGGKVAQLIETEDVKQLKLAAANPAHTATLTKRGADELRKVYITP